MTRIWIHTIICCKTPYFRELEQHWLLAKAEIIKESLQNDIVINGIDGNSTHLHCIINLGENQNINDTVKLLKEISSSIIKKHKLTNTKFEWIDEYMAFSVSDLLLDLEKHCISTQTKYHEKWELKEEITQILNECRYPYE